MTTVGRFLIEYTRFLEPDGEATQPLPEFAREVDHLIPLTARCS
jgi:2-oxoisovalerate dehydrogenase E1 component alpha subunit